jgi:hypothetical protein
VESQKVYNPNPRGRGQICPHHFHEPITQKVLKCKKLAKMKYSTEKFCCINVLGNVPIKKRRFMPVLCLRKGQCLKNVGLQCVPSLTVATFSPTCGWGGGGEWEQGVGGSRCIFETPLTAKTRLFIPGLSASQTSEQFLSELKDVAFCIYIINSRN